MLPLTSAAAVVVAALYAARDGRPAWDALAPALPVCVLGQLPVVIRRIGRNLDDLNLGEISLIIALALVPGPWVVLLSLPTTLGAHLVAGHRPLPALLRAAVVTTSTGAAVLAAAAVMGGRDLPAALPDTRAFAAVAVAAMVCGILTWLLTLPSTFAATRSRWPVHRMPHDSLAILRMQPIVANTALGLLVLAAASWNPVVALALPLAAAGPGIGHYRRLRSLEERGHWDEVNTAARELADADEPTVVMIAQRKAETLFHADSTVLTIWSPVPTDTAPTESTSTDTTSATTDQRAPATAERHPSPGTPPEDVRQEDPLPGRDTRRQEERQPAPPGRRRWLPSRIREVSAPLLAGEEQIGVLTLGFRRPTAWRRHEEQVLAAFTQTVSRALAHARLEAHARQVAEEQAHDAGHDWLTGLGNRRLLMARAAAEMRRQAETGRSVALVMIDLDRFKIINDTLGHSAGDRVLQAVAERLRRGIRADDVVARLGGDEFAVLVTGIDDPAQAEATAAELADVLCRDVVMDGIPLAVEASLGVACHPQDGSTIEELLKHADIAMYQAKHSHPRWRRFDAGSHDPSLERLALVAELRSAISGNELVLNYQPQVELRTGRISGVEALVRWKHPRRGMLTPEMFVPAIEQSGLVQDFTKAILEQALVACAGWRASGFDITVSVNLSARNLLNTELPGDVAKLLVKHDVPAAALTLEITETAMMSDKRTAYRLLGKLREIGVRIAVDDFGTGFSSLTMLQERILDEVKVDQSFVRKLLVEQGDAAIVSATIHLAHTHNLQVVAEGVETAELMAALAALRCDFVQGLHTGAAMPLPELTAYLRASESAPRQAGRHERPDPAAVPQAAPRPQTRRGLTSPGTQPRDAGRPGPESGPATRREGVPRQARPGPLRRHPHR
ncbi:MULTISPECIES: putative bifunctional diguanylate cyclase/phosphodiesterase [Protofrankia]|uniref:putative bifunctional diguanylate cyclase/phosphodiesterase n=1 Tax=Protofrankia TaxID=2994361 RepID=UPI0002E0525F|nr:MULTISPECIES: EAL domain-containing protein [Protofrankia]